MEQKEIEKKEDSVSESTETNKADKKINYKKYLKPGIVAALCLFVFLSFSLDHENGKYKIKTSSVVSNYLGIGGSFSYNEMKKHLFEYIDTNLTQGMVDFKITGISEESGVYRVTIELDGSEFDSFVSKDGKIFFPEGIDMTESLVNAVNRTIGDFIETENDVCVDEQGKPLVYFFGNSDCPYCEWQKPIMTESMSLFGDNVSYKENIDSEEDLDVFFQYSEGSVPLTVIGCKYYRIGAGVNFTEEEDVDNISALTCSLIDNELVDVCEKVSDLIGEINN